MNALAPFLLFLVLLGALAVVLVPIGFWVWVRDLRNRPYPQAIPDGELALIVRREFARPPATDLDEGFRRLAALITKGQS